MLSTLSNAVSTLANDWWLVLWFTHSTWNNRDANILQIK